MDNTGIAALGRGDDSMLVHMTPEEVDALQGLALSHGGSLTINPETGLPEAGFLGKILPTLLGVGANFLLPGSGLLIGGLTGLATGLITGDWKKGIGAGLGAYGGAALGSGLQSMVNPVASVANTAAIGAAPAAASAATAIPGGAAALSPAAAPVLNSGAGSALSNLGSGVGQVAKGNFGAFDPVGTGTDWLGTGGKSLLKSSAFAAAPFLMAEEKFKSPYGEGDTGEWSPTPPPKGGYQWGGDRPKFQSERDILRGNGSEFSHYGPNYGTTKYNSDQRNSPYYRINKAEGGSIDSDGWGITALGQGGGGYLDGPGDGLSDSIPAEINHGSGANQPARLADGEFVIPADVVSHIGNGSSNAGSKQLYNMLDRVREAKTGKQKQAPSVNPKKYMVA